MTLKRYIQTLIIVLLIFDIITLSTCEKPERIVDFKTLDTKTEDISFSSVILKGEITDLGSKAIEQHGLILSESSVPELGQQNCIEKPLGPATLKGVFQAQFTGLKSNVTYYFRTFVVIESVPQLGTIKQFTTTDAIPAATTEAATAISSKSANLKGTINTKDLEATVTFEYGLTTDYGYVVTVAEDYNYTGMEGATIYNLNPSTLYHFRIKVVNEAGTTYGSDMSFTTPGTITDAVGNEYNVVIIGAQMWIQENLKTTKFTDDTDIPLITDNIEWSALTTPGFCYYNNDEDNYRDLYGALYNWYAVNSGILCPAGWHVVSDGGWTVLTDYLGGENTAGGKLKEDHEEHWASPNTDATNETTFCALPGGYRDKTTGAFSEIGQNGYFWTSTESSPTGSWFRSLHYDNGSVSRDNNSKRSGYSVRCAEGGLPYDVETGSATIVTSTSVTLNGIINPNSTNTEVTFEYGTTTSYGFSVTADQSPVSGSDHINVSAIPEGLIPGTTYHYRLKAENSAGVIYGNDIEFVTPDQVTDADGNVYETIIIGDQVWMNENLKTTKLNDNTDIPNLITNTAWQGELNPGYCWYDNDQTNYSSFGLLYNWYAVNTGKLCPSSWHVPTEEEWAILADYGTTDETGFLVLFGGGRDHTGVFDGINYYGNWWSSTEFTSMVNAFYYGIVNGSVSFERIFSNNEFGYSIRCIKD